MPTTTYSPFGSTDYQNSALYYKATHKKPSVMWDKDMVQQFPQQIN